MDCCFKLLVTTLATNTLYVSMSLLTLLLGDRVASHWDFQWAKNYGGRTRKDSHWSPFSAPNRQPRGSHRLLWTWNNKRWRQEEGAKVREGAKGPREAPRRQEAMMRLGCRTRGIQGENDSQSEGLAQPLWNNLIFIRRRRYFRSDPHNLIILP